MTTLKEDLDYGIANNLITLEEFNSFSFSEQIEVIRDIESQMNEMARRTIFSAGHTINDHPIGQLKKAQREVDELLFETIGWINERKIRATLESNHFEAMWLQEKMSSLQFLVGEGGGRSGHDIFSICRGLFATPEDPPAYVIGREKTTWEKCQLRLVLERKIFWRERREKIAIAELDKAKNQGCWD